MAPSRLIRWAHVSWPALNEHHELLIVPIGSIEQHGPHLPLTSDTLAPIGIIERLAERTSRPIVMGVPIDYTYAPESEIYPGTLSLAGTTVSAMVADMVVSYGRHDFGLIVFLNGHLESAAFVLEGLRLGSQRLGRDQRILLVNWWDLVSTATLERVYPGVWPGWVSEHAAVIESSLMLALFPEFVTETSVPVGDTYRLLEYKRIPADPRHKPESGSFATAAGSSAAIGDAIVEEVVIALDRVISTELERT